MSDFTTTEAPGPLPASLEESPLGRNDWSYAALIDRIRSPIAASAVLLGIFVAMSLVAGGVVRLLGPTEVDVQAKPAIERLPAPGSSLAAGPDRTLPGAEETHAYAN